MKWLLDLLAAFFKPHQPPTPVVEASDPALRLMVSAAGCVRPDDVAEAFDHAFRRFGLHENVKAQVHIIANCAHESGDFTFTRENLSYSSVERILAVFGTNRGIKTLSNAQLQGLVRNPEALGNIVYADANRSDAFKLGNVEPGDGYRFRGWGWAQLTGREVMTKFARHLGISVDTLERMTDDSTFAHAAVWFAVVYQRGFIASAANDDVIGTRRAWNGGTNGLDDVRKRRERIRNLTGV